MNVIEVGNLKKKYTTEYVLNNITFKFESGHIYGIVGINGSGKTTLFESIVGNISFNGSINIIKGKTIGYLPENLFFYSKTTGLEYIEFFISARGEKPDKRQINKLNEFFKLPLDTKFSQEYSAGMKKKLAFMAILLQKNDIYILDEPFNNLDITAITTFQKIIKTLSEKNKTVIISSHILEPIKKTCDSISILHKGTFVKTINSENYNSIDVFFESIFEDLDGIKELF